MSKMALKRFSLPRPQEDFLVDSISVLLDIARRHEMASFPPLSREIILRRYWQYISFLQRYGFTKHIIAGSFDDISPASELRNSDLTDEGFRFVQYSHHRWLDRTYKDEGEEREEKMLQGWLVKFTALRSPNKLLHATRETRAREQ